MDREEDMKMDKGDNDEYLCTRCMKIYKESYCDGDKGCPFCWREKNRGGLMLRECSECGLLGEGCDCGDRR